MKKLDMSMLKQAVEDILVRKPDLDEGKQPPKAQAPDDGTSKAPNPKADIGADSPEQAVTDKAAWDALSEPEQAYLCGFVDQCKRAGVNPELFMPAEFAKQAFNPAMLANLLGKARMLGGRIGQIGAQAGQRAMTAGKALGQRAMTAGKALGQRTMTAGKALGQKLTPTTPGQAALAGAAGGTLGGLALADGGDAAQPAAEEFKLGAYTDGFLTMCAQAGLTAEQATALLAQRK